MPTLHSCAACGQLNVESNTRCAFCGGAVRRGGLGPTALFMGLALSASACAQDLYGIAYTDEDGDGYAAEADDCDDTDASVNPGAIDTVDDGVDSNCDGDDNT
ncbi:MAG: putative metal-binding motif-containing protein [Deltaproteobacteria bacterium]|jgi:hypothetical protein|nr:putative metal-binding motif-containing protein [Deltaproteobacteria bacterium]